MICSEAPSNGFDNFERLRRPEKLSNFDVCLLFQKTVKSSCEMKILFCLILLPFFTRSISNEVIDTVPVRSPDTFPIIFSIVDLLEDNSEIFGTEDEINLIDENVELIPAVQVICKTVGGPNPGRDCIFPFKWNDKVHNGCPIDPNDERSVYVFID